MNITSDIECGNGKNIREVVPGQFYMEEVGEEPPYCKYFCVQVASKGDGGRIRLDVYPDPLLGERGRRGMMGHYPSPIWFSQDDADKRRPMESWKPVEHVLDRTLHFHTTASTLFPIRRPCIGTSFGQRATQLCGTGLSGIRTASRATGGLPL